MRISKMENANKIVNRKSIILKLINSLNSKSIKSLKWLLYKINKLDITLY